MKKICNLLFAWYMASSINVNHIYVTAECIKWHMRCSIKKSFYSLKEGKLLQRVLVLASGNLKPLAVRFIDHLKSWIDLMRKRNTCRSVVWIKNNLWAWNSFYTEGGKWFNWKKCKAADRFFHKNLETGRAWHLKKTIVFPTGHVFLFQCFHFWAA